MCLKLDPNNLPVQASISQFLTLDRTYLVPENYNLIVNTSTPCKFSILQGVPEGDVWLDSQLTVSSALPTRNTPEVMQGHSRRNILLNLPFDCMTILQWNYSCLWLPSQGPSPNFNKVHSCLCGTITITVTYKTAEIVHCTSPLTYHMSIDPV